MILTTELVRFTPLYETEVVHDQFTTGGCLLVLACPKKKRIPFNSMTEYENPSLNCMYYRLTSVADQEGVNGASPSPSNHKTPIL